MDHKTNLNKLKRIGILQSVLSDDNGIKLESITGRQQNHIVCSKLFTD